MIYKEKFGEILQHYGVKGMTWDEDKKRDNEKKETSITTKVKNGPAGPLPKPVPDDVLAAQLVAKINKDMAAKKAANRKSEREAIREVGRLTKKKISSTYKDAKRGANNLYKDVVPKDVRKKISSVMPKKQSKVEKKVSDAYKSAKSTVEKRHKSASKKFDKKLDDIRRSLRNR